MVTFLIIFVVVVLFMSDGLSFMIFSNNGKIVGKQYYKILYNNANKKIERSPIINHILYIGGMETFPNYISKVPISIFFPYYISDGWYCF